MKRRLAAGTAVSAGLVLSLTGCLGDSGGGDKAGAGAEGGKSVVLAADMMRKSSDTTSKVETVKADVQTEVTAPGTGKTVTMHMRMDSKLRPEPAFRMTIDSMNMGGTSVGGQGGMELIMVGHAVYMKSALFAQLTHGKPWLKISSSELGAASGQNFDQLIEQQKQADPAEQTRMFTASKDVREVGKETVNGVETTHYRGTVSLQEIEAKLPAASRPQQMKSFQKLGLQSLAFDLWVDGKQLPAKVVVKSPEGASTKMNTTVVYSGWNTPVTVTAPPASEVGPMPKLPSLGAPGA
ncbi:DUF6612 family protein [Actinomadura harenae]|uniref:LppX_LprAFG lipoprotein n=1 Tax=Actinomadura harenae TaxID=2483351 RepID=A0A3M2MEV1_9ACTN|nr:LppX_LprAFG lipoprotein [Actinomadura harenae]RMI47550.1 LppX_LprAFG lipoprotein [Actinomadura harenae]